MSALDLPRWFALGACALGWGCVVPVFASGGDAFVQCPGLPSDDTGPLTKGGEAVAFVTSAPQGCALVGEVTGVSHVLESPPSSTSSFESSPDEARRRADAERQVRNLAAAAGATHVVVDAENAFVFRHDSCTPRPAHYVALYGRAYRCGGPPPRR